MNKEIFDFYDKTVLKSYNLDESMRYQLNMLDSLDVFTRKHSENVANLVCRLCEYLHCNKGFTEYCTICAYLHDIGFYLQDEVVLKRFCRWAKIDFPEKNRGTFYRKRHPQISAFWIWCNITNNINLPQIYYGDKSLAYSVMKIVMSHGMDFWKDPQYFYKMQVNGNIINEIYLSYLLCLGDTLDCDKRRIANINNIESVKIEDKIYLRRHYYIEKVLLEKNNIKIVINIPNVKSKNIKLFNYFYIEKATEWIYYWEKMCSELFANNLKFPSIDLCILQNSKISEPTQIEYNYIKQIINEQYGKIYNK